MTIMERSHTGRSLFNTYLTNTERAVYGMFLFFIGAGIGQSNLLPVSERMSFGLTVASFLSMLFYFALARSVFWLHDCLLKRRQFEWLKVAVHDGLAATFLGIMMVAGMNQWQEVAAEFSAADISRIIAYIGGIWVALWLINTVVYSVAYISINSEIVPKEKRKRLELETTADETLAAFDTYLESQPPAALQQQA